MKVFADDNSYLGENGRQFSKVVDTIENIGKRRNCSLRAISPFPTVYSKGLYCRHEKKPGSFGKGFKIYHFVGLIHCMANVGGDRQTGKERERWEDTDRHREMVEREREGWEDIDRHREREGER